MSRGLYAPGRGCPAKSQYQVADNNGDVDGDGWTNLEEYINSLNP